jgi:hypothetical protein
MNHPRQQILVDRLQVLIPRLQRIIVTTQQQETDARAALDAALAVADELREGAAPGETEGERR